MDRLPPQFVALIVAGWLPPAALAVVCHVPSASHPTVEAAVRDADCVTVELAAGVYSENVTIGRDCNLSGAGSTQTTLAGVLAAGGADVGVNVDALRIDATSVGVAGCARAALLAGGGARLTIGPDVLVLQTAAAGTFCRIFADGFESGGVLAWSVCAP